MRKRNQFMKVLWLALPLLVPATVINKASQLPVLASDTIKAKYLQLSAVINEDSAPYDAKIECWELITPFIDYPTIGTFLPLANISNLTYVALPPNSSEGLHHPPHPMFFILLSGAAHVTLPAYPSSEGLWILEGINPVIIATDTLGVGHNTFYPGNKTTVALQAPFKDGIVPDHVVIGKGPCPSRV